MKKNIFVIFFILTVVVIVAPKSLAVDYSIVKLNAVQKLEKLSNETNLSLFNVKVDTNSTNFYFKGTLEYDNMLSNLCGCVAVYSNIVDTNPDVGDLKLVYMDTHLTSLNFFTCKKDWILETGRYPNDAELRTLIDKIRNTYSVVGKEITPPN